MIRGAFIGIDRHADPSIGDLTGAARDATALWAVLSDSIADLDAPLITSEAATLVAMRDVLDATLGAADEDDVVILGFAGHGTQDHRLVLHDTSVADLPNTTLGMDELAERFRETRARAVILLLDCCFSGGAPARVIDAGLVPRDAVSFPLVDVAGQGRILFAASSLPPWGDPFGMLVHARSEALGCGGPAGTLASSGDEAVLAHRSHCTVSIFCR